MIVHLCSILEVPLRNRNDILLAAGYAPRYSHVAINDHITSTVRDAIDMVVNAHVFPAVVVDSNWDLVTSNQAAAIFLDGVAGHLLEPPTNVIRLTLHYDGLARRIVNFDEYATHVIARMKRSTAHHPSERLDALIDEFGHLASRLADTQRPGILLPLELSTQNGIIRLFSTITTFGSPHDVTLEELAIETFYPADSASRAALETIAAPMGD